jgi:hypothetical protein
LVPNESEPHVIIIGPTGSGKTELVKRMVRDFSGAIFAIDFKNGEGFGSLDRLQAMITNESTEQEVAAFLDSLERASSLRLPLMLIVDELGEAMKNREIAGQLERYAAQGRSRRTYLVLANQTLSLIPRTVWTNCATRVGLSADPVDLAQLQITAKSPNDPDGPRVALIKKGSANLIGYLPDLGLAGESSDDLRNNRAPAGDTFDLVSPIGPQQGSPSGDEAQRLGLPARRFVLNPGKLGKRRVIAENQISHGAPSEIAGSNPVSDIATRLTQLGH